MAVSNHCVAVAEHNRIKASVLVFLYEQRGLRASFHAILDKLKGAHQPVEASATDKLRGRMWNALIALEDKGYLKWLGGDIFQLTATGWLSMVRSEQQCLKNSTVARLALAGACSAG